MNDSMEHWLNDIERRETDILSENLSRCYCGQKGTDVIRNKYEGVD
jgi:hypothetical protein